MNEQQIQIYKNQLEKERTMLFAEIKQSDKSPDFGGDTEDPDEETDKAEEVGNQLAISQDLKNRLGDIDIALGKIYAGKYGICEKCEGPIEKEILDIDPESRFCKRCKSEK